MQLETEISTNKKQQQKLANEKLQQRAREHREQCYL